MVRQIVVALAEPPAEFLDQRDRRFAKPMPVVNDPVSKYRRPVRFALAIRSTTGCTSPGDRARMTSPSLWLGPAARVIYAWSDVFIPEVQFRRPLEREPRLETPRLHWRSHGSRTSAVAQRYV
jgi:hypothetical protein